MGKLLRDLINDKQAIADLAAQQAGNRVPLTNATRNTIIPNNIGEIVKKLVGEEGLQREEADLVQIGNFVKNIPKIYGTDSVRILTQSDPHAKKAAIKKAAGAVGSVFGTTGLGRLINKGISKIGDFNPKFPDDFLDGDTFNRYADLAKSDYAGGKYYNGGIKNKKSDVGQFLQANKTFGQIQNALIPAAKTALVGLAIGGLKKLFTKKLKTLPDEPNKRAQPFFPSTLVLNSNPNSQEFIAYNQEQQSRRNDFPTKFGSDYTKVSKSIGVPIEGAVSKLKNKEASLDTFYKTQFYNNSVYFDPEQYNLNNPNSPKGFKTPSGYNSRLGWHGEQDYNNAVGKYSKDVLRIWQSETKDWSEPYPTVKLANEAAEGTYTGSLHLNYFTTDLSFNGGDGTINDYGKFANAQSTLSKGSYYASYTPINSEYSPGATDIKPIRWNTIKAPYSTAYTIKGQADSGNNILDRDYYFAENSKQSQKNVNKNINPYWHKKVEVLNTEPKTASDKYDRVKFHIGTVNLLGTLTGITDNTTPSWSDVKPVGSGFKFYIYDSWEREISFKIRCYAESQNELNSIWRRANQIKSYTLPTAGGILGVFGKTIPLKIGNLITIPFGFLTQCNVTILDESPWEITEGLQKPFIFDMDISYKVITNDDKHEHYDNQFPFIPAYKYNSTPGIDNNLITPPNVGGPVLIDEIPVDTTIITNTDIPDGFSPLIGGIGNPLKDRLKGIDDADNFNSTGTGVTGTPVTNKIPPGPERKVDLEIDLTGTPEARTDSLKMQEEVKDKFTKGAGYGGGGTIIIENTYIGDKPKWWQFTERRKYNRSFTVHLSGQTK